MEEIESHLRSYEPSLSTSASTNGLRANLPASRANTNFPSARILGLSAAAQKHCLPHLDVGDTREWIAVHAGRDGPDCYSSGPMADATNSAGAGGEPTKRRKELSDVLSGRLVGATFAQPPVDREGKEEESDEVRLARRMSELSERAHKQGEAYAPWSLCYGGHQFGSWAGQLGDGRAISLRELAD